MTRTPLCSDFEARRPLLCDSIVALTAANVQPVKLPMALAESTCFAPVGLQIASGSPRSVSDLVSMSGNSALRAAPVDRALAGEALVRVAVVTLGLKYG